jgi:adenine phosphoribosyltransferase
MEKPDIELSKYIRSIPDFPKKGIIFRDITPLLLNPDAFRAAIEKFYSKYKDSRINKVLSIESRGFIFGSALAYRLGVGFIPIRKPKKLPSDVIREEYQLEYGTDALEIHKDAIQPGDKVLVVDDLLATGGTALATCRLAERLGGIVTGIAFLVELTFLNGRKKLDKYDIFSILKYDKEA